MIDPIMADDPDFCFECGKMIPKGEARHRKLVDLDLGDPEVGPDPDICEVDVCTKCHKVKA